jgi:hypothetical protein
MEQRRFASVLRFSTDAPDRLRETTHVQVAHGRKVRDVAPLACKTDKVDARVLAELCRRDLVPELWIPSLDDRALRERLRRRMHLVRMRASAMNRIFGLLTQWGLRLSLQRLRALDAMALLESRGVPAAWRRSIAEALAVIDLLDARIAPLEAELGPLARADPRVLLLTTIPGVGELLGLTLASEIGDVARFAASRKLIGYAGLAPRVSQSGDRSRTGALSKAGSRTLRWAAVEAAQHAWRPTNPWQAPCVDVGRRLPERMYDRRSMQGHDFALAGPFHDGAHVLPALGPLLPVVFHTGWRLVHLGQDVGRVARWLRRRIDRIRQLRALHEVVKQEGLVSLAVVRALDPCCMAPPDPVTFLHEVWGGREDDRELGLPLMGHRLFLRRRRRAKCCLGVWVSEPRGPSGPRGAPTQPAPSRQKRVFTC